MPNSLSPPLSPATCCLRSQFAPPDLRRRVRSAPRPPSRGAHGTKPDPCRCRDGLYSSDAAAQRRMGTSTVAEGPAQRRRDQHSGGKTSTAAGGPAQRRGDQHSGGGPAQRRGRPVQRRRDDDYDLVFFFEGGPDCRRSSAKGPVQQSSGDQHSGGGTSTIILAGIA